MVRGRYLYILHFGVKRSKVKVTTELCQHFGSDTITWVLFNVQLWNFIHRCRMMRGKYLYILRAMVKVSTELCQHFGTEIITWVLFNIQLSYIIHRCRIVREIYLYILRSGSKSKVITKKLTVIVTLYSHFRSRCQATYTNHKKSIFSVVYLDSVRLIASCDSSVHVSFDEFDLLFFLNINFLRRFIEPIIVLWWLKSANQNLLSPCQCLLRHGQLKFDSRVSSFISHHKK